MATKLVMPEMGEGVFEGTVSRWLKEEGNTVDQYEPILEIETDKVTTEATAEEAGTLLKIYVEEGETVEVGTVLAYIGEPGEDVPPDREAAKEAEVASASLVEEPAEAEASAEVATPATETTKAGDGRAADGTAAKRTAEPVAGKTQTRETTTTDKKQKPYTGRISPVVGRIAAEHDVDLSRLEGTGRNGRITKKDILAYIETRQAEPEPAPEPEPMSAPEPTTAPERKREPAPVPAPRGEEMAVAGETVPLTSMRRRIAEHMVRSKRTSPHVTTVFEVDFSAVAAHRQAHKEQFARDDVRLTYTAYIVAATVQALKEHPMVNSTWSEDGIVLKRDINVGVAAAIEDGLIVPVIKDADTLNLLGLARTINDLAYRARANKLKPEEVQGGTFSITNHGVSGSLFATPIINQPQCGILGVGKIEKRVKVIDDAIAIRPLAYVSLTFDHRILDGASADNFLSTVKEAIENWH